MQLRKSIAYFKQTFLDDSPVDIQLEAEDAPLCLKYLDGVSIFFLIDEGSYFSFVQAKHLRSSGCTEQELLEWGVENLRGILENIQITKNEGVLYFSGSGNFEASLLLIPELWEPGLAEHCPNGFIAAIPARDVLVVCDIKDSAGVEKLSSVVEKVWLDGDHLLTKELVVRTDGKWQPAIKI